MNIMNTKSLDWISIVYLCKDWLFLDTRAGFLALVAA